MVRIVIPGQPHHVVQRSNNRQDVFFVDDDRRAYLELLRERCVRFGFNVLGYCLMTNHIHLVGPPALEDSLAKAIGVMPTGSVTTGWPWRESISKSGGWHGHREA